MTAVNRCKENIRRTTLLLRRYGKNALPATVLLWLGLTLVVLYSPFYHQRILLNFSAPQTGTVSVFYDNAGTIDLLPQHARLVRLDKAGMAVVELPFRANSLCFLFDDSGMRDSLTSVAVNGAVIDRKALRPMQSNLLLKETPLPPLLHGGSLPALFLAFLTSLFFLAALVHRRPEDLRRTVIHGGALAGQVVVFWGIVFAFAAFEPYFPRTGLDDSWKYGMDEALVNHLRIGRDIVFTFGPYASIYTRIFHPGLVDFSLLCQILMGLAYAGLFCLYARGSRIYLQLLFMALLLIFSAATLDALLYLYPLLWGFYIFKTAHGNGDDRSRNAALDAAALWICLFAIPLGLLILVKGTLIGVCGGIAAAALVYFISRKRYLLAAATAVVPTVSCLGFWMLSGQKLIDLPVYFLNMMPIVSGYTPAMSMEADNVGTKQLLFFLLSLLAVWNLIRMQTKKAEKVFAVIIFLLFLFVSFKGGFVRHGGYASAASLLLGSLILCFVRSKAVGRFALFASFLFFLYMDFQHGNHLSGIYDGTVNRYKQSIQAASDIRSWKAHMLAVHSSTRRDIQWQYPIPELPGTTDLYPFRQGALFASANTWNPRPVFQSYSAYTEKLARMNEEHLRGEKAPDNIIFDLNRDDCIDFRLPGMDDGNSWPALLDNYHVTGNDRFIYLRKNGKIRKSSTFRTVFEGEVMVGQQLAVPYFPNGARLYARVEVEPTLIGRLGTFFCRTEATYAVFTLNNGRRQYFRVVPEMLKSGFFLSPLVTSREEFVDFHRNALARLNDKAVRGFCLQYDSLLWSPKYRLTILQFIPSQE